MNKYAPEIASLRMDIEQSVKRKIRTPYDFEFLAGCYLGATAREYLTYHPQTPLGLY